MTIHRRATAWDAGEVPDSLYSLITEHLSAATIWSVQPRAGKSGYRHCGLEIDVVQDKTNAGGDESLETISTAVMAMVMEHYDAHAAPFYQVEAWDYNEEGHKVVLGGCVLKLSPDGPEDLESMSGGAWAFKELANVHKRYCELLDKIDGVVDLSARCMDAMAGAFASIATVQLDNATGVADREKAEREGKTKDKVLDFIFAQAQASAQKNPLAKVLNEMPVNVRDICKAAVGEVVFELFVKAAGEDDPQTRAEILAGALGRITEAQKVELGKVPGEWATKLQAAFASTLQAGQKAA